MRSYLILTSVVLSVGLLFSQLNPLTAPAADAPKPRHEQRWIYFHGGFAGDAGVKQMLDLIERGRKAGYNGMVVADYKFNVLERQGPEYFRNVAKVRAAADAAGIEIIPCVFPIGYSDGLFTHNPNWAEGIPVKDSPYVVKDGIAVLAKPAQPLLVNGNLEQTKREHMFIGWGSQIDPGKTTFADRSVVHKSKVSCRMESPQKTADNPGANCRLAQSVKVRPFTCYRLSCWIKTQDVKPTQCFQFRVFGKNTRKLVFHETHIKPTADWTEYEVVFNSVDEPEVQINVGQFGGSTGKMWLADIKLEEVSLVNILRRDGCPLTITSADGKTVYEEGKDFQPVADTKLFADPDAGRYGHQHAGPQIRITPNSRIKEGDKLRVSWYHPIINYGKDQVMCCLTEPKIYDKLRDQAKAVNDLLKPKTFMMSHDEIRCAGWCKGCTADGKTPGQLLADNASKCVKILKEINPSAKILVWNDMFDPTHNAVNGFYFVNGPLAESWKGLPPEVGIVNWNGGKEKSLKFFADRGHSQIVAGFYDGDAKDIPYWVDAGKDIKGVTGFMYTTWENNYKHLEAYGAALQGKK